ncbi:MAG: response regulator [Geobacteraceae bacterium]|nr:response regulator [Geobacteraceae bacterium]
MKQKKILVVDDSEIVLAMACDALKEAGFEVVTALSAMEADSCIFSGDRPDLIILDVMLPMLDGDKKAKMLKDNELTRDIPILLLSSKPENELSRLVRESGADGFIRKPFTPQLMVSRVEETIGGISGGS